MICPQLTGRTPDRAPNRVLATVRVIRFGFSGFRIGIMNSNILLSLGLVHFPGWRPSLGWMAPENFPAHNPSFRPAHPSAIPVLNPYTSHQVSGVQLSGSLRSVLSHWFPLLNRNSLKVSSDGTFQGRSSKPIHPMARRSSSNSRLSLPSVGIAGRIGFTGTFGRASMLSGLSLMYPLFPQFSGTPSLRSSGNPTAGNSRKVEPQQSNGWWLEITMRSPSNPTAGDSKSTGSPLVHSLALAREKEEGRRRRKWPLNTYFPLPLSLSR